MRPQRIKCEFVRYGLPRVLRKTRQMNIMATTMISIALRINDKPKLQHFGLTRHNNRSRRGQIPVSKPWREEISGHSKFANGHLTPEKLDYAGGSWHIEWQLNEYIVATTLYYYDNDKVTDSHLSFHTKVNADLFNQSIGYEQNDFKGIGKVFDVSNNNWNG